MLSRFPSETLVAVPSALLHLNTIHHVWFYLRDGGIVVEPRQSKDKDVLPVDSVALDFETALGTKRTGMFNVGALWRDIWF